jgi:hypothetical protein
MRSPSKCRPLGASDCKVRKGCAWVKAHNGRNGVAISSMCRGVRVSKKSPKRSPKPRGRPRKSPAVRRSRCNSKRRSECKESAASCRWVSGYVNSKTNKKVASMCRRRRRRVSAKSASPRKASPHFLRTVRSM